MTDLVTQIRDILGVTLDTESGSFLGQLGDAVTAEVTGSEAELWQQPGFASAPPPPTLGVAAQALVIPGDVDQCIAYRDPRQAAVYGALGPGETCLFALGPSGAGTLRLILKDDGAKATFMLVVNKDNAPDGENIVFTIDSTGALAFLSSLGGFAINADGITLSTDKGGISIDAQGNGTWMGPQLSLAGQSVALGIGASAATAPLVGPAIPVGVAPGAPIVGVVPSKSVLIAP